LRRREFIIGTASGAIAATAAGAKEFPAKPRGPDHFLWGTAGAAYQIEGGNVASDLWVLEHVEPTLFPTPSGDACDTYNRFGEDLALSASLGFNAHRFSIEWSRIEPERGQISKAGLAYYRRVLEACQTHGLAPAVTLSHVSVPRWIAASGGFANPINVAAFAAHCGRIARAMGDLISLAATFNEPNAWTLALWGGYIDQQLATIKAMQSAAAAVTSSPNWASPMVSGLGQYDGIVAAHTAAITAIRDAGGTFPIGFALAVMADHAANGGESALERKQSDMLDRWLAAPGDFIGVQAYTGVPVGPLGDQSPPAGVELTQMHYPFLPEAAEMAVRLVAKRTSKPIYITENGVGTEDDSRQIAFIHGAVAGVERCRSDGIDVRGYFHWSLLDNWEWTSGYKPKFGLVAVDRETFRRMPKPSARYLGDIARRGGLT
jgi:beta-glucosidase